ncbi:MAG: hypothetical protein ABJC62_12295 [Frankiaceae bacterium]
MSRRLSWVSGPGVTPVVLGYAPLAVAALAAGWLLAGLPLLLAGGYRPLPATLLGAPVAFTSAWYVLRRCPRLDGPAWAGWLTLAVVAGFAVLAWGWSAEHVVLRRDSGAYGLYAHWLAHSGRLPIPASAPVFGPGVSHASPAFFADGGSVVPQFLPGTPMLLAAAGWLGGLTGILHANALLGAAALLAVAGLTARLVGPRAAPFAAFGAGLAYPVLHAARSPYSEPLALLLLFGGLALLSERRLAFAGGLLAGLATVARIDAPADLLLLVPYAVLAAPLAGTGLVLGVGIGLVGGLVLSRPYVGSVGGELLMITGAAVLLVGVCLAVRRRWRVRAPGWLPPLAATAVITAAGLFAVRPLLQTVRRPNPARGMIGVLQRRQGLPRDPTRTYDERTLHWVSWWLGWPLVILAVGGLALLAYRRLQASPGREKYDPAPFLLVLAAASGIVLWKPSITPDHPWADRRLVPVVLPGLVICAAWLIGRLPDWLPARRAAAAMVLAGAIGYTPLAAASAPLLGVATERGEVAAVRQSCQRLGPRAAVVVTGSRGRNELPQTLRGLCRVPVAVVREQHLATTLPAVRAAVAHSGRQLAVVAMTPAPLRAAGLRPVQVTALRTREDARLLLQRPRGDVPLTVDIWLAR